MHKITTDILNARGRVPTPQAILFDLDGTILDTGDLIMSSLRFAVNEKAGKSYSDKALMAGVGTPLIEQLRELTPENPEGTFDTYQQHNAIHHDTSIDVFEGIPGLLAQLEAEGMPMAIVTSKRHELAVRGLELFGLMDHFEFLLGADDVVRAKPDPFPVLAACKRLGVDPVSTLYIGDSPHDIRAANDAEAWSIAATWGMFPLTDLIAEKPDRVIHEPQQIRDLWK